MLQDIGPHGLNIRFEDLQETAPDDRDPVLVWREESLLLLEGEGLALPSRAQWRATGGDLSTARPLFLLDGRPVWSLELGEQPQRSPAGSRFAAPGSLRGADPKHLAFAVQVGAHLHRWYENHRFCGRCGGAFRDSDTERALVCPDCGLVEYPRINPAVIVGVTWGDRLLLTRYAGRPYRRWALIAGFCEIGESLEDTVRREVREEVGLEVSKLRYYRSQPWPFSDSLLMGFFCEAAGDPTPRPDQKELAEAAWFPRTGLPVEDPALLSLTQTMIAAFRDGRDKEETP